MPNTVDRARIRELTSQLQTKATELDRLADTWQDETGNGHLVISTEQKDAYQRVLGEAEEIKTLLRFEEGRGQLHEFLSAPAGSPLAASEAAAMGVGYSQKSLGQMYIESAQYGELKQGGFDIRRLPGAFESGMGIAQLERKDVYSNMAGNIAIPALGTPQNVGLTPRQLRPGRVRDLFPQDTTTANMLYGIRETGFTNNAAPVEERVAANGGPATGGATDVYSTKPHSNISIVPVQYPVSTIAHWINVHKNTLADEPRMMGLIDRDLMDGVKLAEDWQIMYGDGQGDHITGICNTPGLQEYAGSTVSDDPQTAQIRRAITRVFLAYYQASGVVVHPMDWESLELERDNYGQYRLAISVAMGAQKVVWRLDVAETVAIAQGTFLTGAFGLGAKLYDRQAVSVAVSTENGSNFIQNVCTVLAEERVALEVSRPESFVLGTFA
jgi:hypothetical protein